MTDAPGNHHDAALVRERVELALPELIPGFRVEERRLTFDGTVVADLLGRSGTQTYLVSLVGEDEDAAALRALDGLSFARSQRELLGDYLPDVSLEGTTPEVVLVAKTFSTHLQARLSALGGAGDFWLVVRHELTTARGSLTRLQRLEQEAGEAGRQNAAVELPDWATQEPLRGFLAQIAPDRLGLALETVDRIQRIDPTLRWRDAGALSVACQLGDAPLCHLAWVDGHLELTLEGAGVPHSIRDEAAIDFVLDWVLTCFLERVDTDRAADTAPQHEAVREPGPFLEDLDPGVQDDEGLEDLELRQVELRPAAPMPLLTDEEIEAFRE